MITIHDAEELWAAIGQPEWLTDLVIERLELDAVVERAYTLGVEHGRAQVSSELEMAEEYVVEVQSVGSCVVDGRGMRFGWLSPDGTYMGCGYARHDYYARKVFGVEGTVLEARGWVKIAHQWAPNLRPGASLTEAQAAFLLSKVK